MDSARTVEIPVIPLPCGHVLRVPDGIPRTLTCEHCDLTWAAERRRGSIILTPK